MPIFELARAILDKSRVKIWFGLVDPFKGYRGNRQEKKKKSQTRLKTIPSKNSFLGGKKILLLRSSDLG